jgi:hypothetical protein
METPTPAINALDMAALAVTSCTRCQRPGFPLYTKLTFDGDKPVYQRLCLECANIFEGIEIPFLERI